MTLVQLSTTFRIMLQTQVARKEANDKEHKFVAAMLRNRHVWDDFFVEVSTTSDAWLQLEMVMSMDLHVASEVILEILTDRSCFYKAIRKSQRNGSLPSRPSVWPGCKKPKTC